VISKKEKGLPSVTWLGRGKRDMFKYGEGGLQGSPTYLFDQAVPSELSCGSRGVNVRGAFEWRSEGVEGYMSPLAGMLFFHMRGGL